MRALFLISAIVLCATGRSGGSKILAVGLAGLLARAVVAPQPAHAQLDPLSGITGVFNAVNQAANSILNFINDTMRPQLEGIQAASEALREFVGQLRNLWEQVVWPISEINRARGLAQQLIGAFRGPLNGLYSIGVNSAQLPNSVRLESVIRNRQVNDHGQLVSAFQQAFGTLPAAVDVHPEERNLIDALRFSSMVSWASRASNHIASQYLADINANRLHFYIPRTPLPHWHDRADRHFTSLDLGRSSLTPHGLPKALHKAEKSPNHRVKATAVDPGHRGASGVRRPSA